MSSASENIMKPLSELATVEYGKSPNEVRDKNGIYPVYGTGGKVGFASSYLFEGDAVIVARKGTLNKPAFVTDKYWVIDTAYATKPKDSIDAKWLYYSLSNFNLESLNEATGVPSISRDFLYKIKFFCPDYFAQQKIAKILTTIDQLIEKTQALIDKHTIIKQGMMADLFTRGIDHTTGQLRPSVELAPHLYKETELGSIPKNWEVDVIDNIVERIIDYRGKTPTKTETGVPLITAKNIRMGYIDPEPREYIAANAYNDWMTRGIPVSGDILFTTEAPLANVAQIQTNDNCAFAQRVIILRCNNRMHNNFLKYSLLSDDLRTRIFIKGSGSTVEGIKQSQFRKIMTSFPTDMKEQLGINDHLKNIESQINSESIYRSKLLKIKSGLMQDLLTGKVRVLANE